MLSPLVPEYAAPLRWTLAALASIASSSAFYTWIWFRPQQWVRLVSPADPCAAMAWAAHALKALQFACVCACTHWASARGLAAWQWLAAVALIAAGQHLNAKVYALLGRDGVYYGSVFGKHIPWQSGWPYSRIRDPQYVGCLLTLAGSACIVPMELVLWWAANYLYLMWLEAQPRGSVRAARKGV